MFEGLKQVSRCGLEQAAGARIFVTPLQFSKSSNILASVDFRRDGLDLQPALEIRRIGKGYGIRLSSNGSRSAVRRVHGRGPNSWVAVLSQRSLAIAP